MKFITETDELEFFASFEENLNKQYSFENDVQTKRISDVLAYLKCAEDALRIVGLRKEAECACMIAKQLKDEPTEGLTSDKMLKNLEEKGWVFNAEDECMDCSEGSEPQLSQQELKELRRILNK